MASRSTFAAATSFWAESTRSVQISASDSHHSELASTVSRSMTATGGSRSRIEGTLDELVDVMNSDLAHWAADWSLPPA